MKMLKCRWLLGKPQLFRSFTGLEVSEFNQFYAKAAVNYDQYEAQRLVREDRKNKRGAGHPFSLPLQERLIMFLIYHRLYITSALAGVLFGIDQSNVLKDIRKLEPLVQSILPTPKRLHEKTKQIQTPQELMAMFPELKAVIDATEQEIPRPKNKRKRKTHYSGKKKRHTVKTQLTVNSKGLIVHKTQHVSGRMHDYALFKRSRAHLPDDVERETDLGYVGVKEDFPDLKFKLPFKKKSPGRGKSGVKAEELSAEQKAFNRQLAKERVVVEHTNSRVKKFMVWGGKFRNRLRHYDVATEIVSGIVNFRILGTLTV